MTDLTEHSIIREAAALINRRGKAVGEFCDDDDRLCPLGAISMVVYGDPFAGSMSAPCRGPQWDLYQGACIVLGNHLWRSGDPIYRCKPTIDAWSDAATQGHVVAAMRAAAAGGA